MGAVVGGETPVRSLQQRMDALQRANQIRCYRAVMKDDFKAGRRSPLLVLAEPAAEVETMKVFDLLKALPKLGRVKADKVLRQLAISPSKTVGGLSPRQRDQLLLELRAWNRGRLPW